MIICCGEALIDMIRSPVSGAANGSRAEGFMPIPGGSPFNTAITIGKLGVPVKYLGRLSSDFFGETLVKRLRDNHVGEELITRSELHTTLAFVKLAKGKEPEYNFYSEKTADLSMGPEDLPPKLPADTSCILFGSLAMTIEPIASAIEALILREGTRKSADQMDGAPVISFDPNIRPFVINNREAYKERFEKWVAASTIAKISQADFEYIYPKLSLEQALQKTLTMGPRLVIGTMGSKGAMALLRRNDGSVIKSCAPAVELPVADTIGAGDSFHGAFLSWLVIKGKMSRSALAGLSEQELYNALFFANKAASLVCSRHGASPPSRREVESLKIPPVKTNQKKPEIKKPAAKKPAQKSTPKTIVQKAKPVVKKPAAVKKPAPVKKPAVAKKTESIKKAKTGKKR